MSTPIVIIGAGGFGREVLCQLRDINEAAAADNREVPFDFLGFIDDGEPDSGALDRIGAKHLGGTDDVHNLPAGTQYVIAIGNGHVRKMLAAKVDAAGLGAATLIHPVTTIGSDVSIGEGTIICPGTRITCNISIGKHVQLNLNNTVGHDAILEDFVTVFPLNAISGYVRLEQEVTLGANSVINPEVVVGHGSFIASGSSVNKDIPAKSLAAGVPAKVKKSLA